jgi:hypothetical protein
MVKRYGRKSGLMLKDVVSLRDKRVTLGSLERSATQAEMVISKSVATLVLAMGLGLIPPATIDSIPRVGQLLEQSAIQDFTDDEYDRALVLIDALLRQTSHQ